MSLSALGSYWAIRGILRYLEIENLFQQKESKNEEQLNAALILQHELYTPYGCFLCLS